MPQIPSSMMIKNQSTKLLFLTEGSVFAISEKRRYKNEDRLQFTAHFSFSISVGGLKGLCGYRYRLHACVGQTTTLVSFVLEFYPSCFQRKIFLIESITHYLLQNCLSASRRDLYKDTQLCLTFYTNALIEAKFSGLYRNFYSPWSRIEPLPEFKVKCEANIN